jgi:hypothetical protein
MRIRYAESYIDQILNAEKGERLSELLCAFTGRPEYDSTAPDLGLPEPAFLLMECSRWMAQSLRSGVWTYYEATPDERQSACLQALQKHAPVDWAEMYSRGMAVWRSPKKTKPIDDWMSRQIDVIDAWLQAFARENRPVLVNLLCR